MSVRFEFKGLDELKAALQALPAELTGEASHIIEAAGNRAVLDLKRGYPVVTGKLRDRVDVTFTSSGVSSKALVQSKAPHAHLFEYGTEARHTGLGLNRGRMFGRYKVAPTHLFGKTMAKVRREMYGELHALLERHGLKVTRGA
jgi:hypothetical protein